MKRLVRHGGRAAPYWVKDSQVTAPLINKRRSARVVRVDPQDAARAGRLAQRDAAYRAALGLAEEDPLPGVLGTQSTAEAHEAPRPRRP
jgi:hypothetical protein